MTLVNDDDAANDNDDDDNGNDDDDQAPPLLPHLWELGISELPPQTPSYIR